MSKPTDDQILAAITSHGAAMTYVVRNILVREQRFPVETPWVLRQLKRLERAGKVERARTSYLVQICWKVVP